MANEHLIADLQEKLRPRADDDLLAIWIENDLEQWSPEYLEAVRRVLTERGVAVPPQDAAGAGARGSCVVHRLEYEEVQKRPTLLEWSLESGWFYVAVCLLCGGTLMVADWIAMGKFSSRPPAAPVPVTPKTWPSQTGPTTRP